MEKAYVDKAFRETYTVPAESLSKMKLSVVACVLFVPLACASILNGQSPTLSIEADAAVSPVSPTLYGLMTEEINFSYDGGLYAEMVRNGTFTNRWPRFEYWTAVAKGNSAAAISDGEGGPSKAL